MLDLERDQSVCFDSIIQKFFHPNDQQAHARDLTRFLKGELDIFPFELRSLHTSSENEHLLCRGTADRKADNRAARLVGTIVDISEQRKIENA